jgi:putative glutamine amidotransferase
MVLSLTPEDNDFSPKPAYRFEHLKQQYYEAIESHGLIPLGIPATEQFENVEQYCRMIDGLMLIGGEDIHPTVYGEPLDKVSKPMMPRRDLFECRMICECVRLEIPILGICRGLQILNVAMGGKLYQDLSFMHGAVNHGQIGELDYSTRHRVEVVPGTKLHEILGADQIETNTGHHQGIRTLGAGLKISARAGDGVVEAIEGDGYVLAVQWHPESWLCDVNSSRLYESYAQAVSNYRSAKGG